MWFCSPLDFTLCRWKIRPWCICVCMCVCVCAGGGVLWSMMVAVIASGSSLPPPPPQLPQQGNGSWCDCRSKQGGETRGNRSTPPPLLSLRNRNISPSTNLPVDRFLLPSCFPLGSRAPHSKPFFLFYITEKNALCFLLPLTFSFCFFPFFGFICIFCLVFFFFSFFHPPPPLLLRLSLSACLLPNEALRIKCLKDCRHFRRFGRHATVHSSLRCSSDDCQTCEEHFEAGVCVGVEGREKKEKVLILHTTTTPPPPTPLLCKRNKSLVNCASSPASRRDARAA